MVVLKTDFVGKDLLELHILSAEIALYETVQTMDCDVPVHRAQALHTCLERVHRFFDILSAQPCDCLPNFPFLAWVHAIHALIVTAKLSFLVVEGWDLQYARTSRMNFSFAADKLIAKLDAVAHVEVGQQPNAVSARFALYAEKIRMCKRWYECRIRSETEPPTAEANDSNDSSSGNMTTATALPAYDPTLEGCFDGLDDALWQDMMADWAGTMQF